ncbi:MAG: phosphate signaling complex protein PhoU [Chloroherpetonaceae bacterium]|nr:phosphate signaling complex protein PhoU [Chloroherpetonaceae bacterium]
MQKNLPILLRELEENIYKMSSETEDLVSDSLKALVEKNLDLANNIIEREKEIDNMELLVNDLVSRILALQQPVAGDLRLIIGSLKIATDLERIADHALNISESAISLMKVEHDFVMNEIFVMGSVVKIMLSGAIESFLEKNTLVARGVLNSDDEVDDYNRSITAKLMDKMATQKLEIGIGLDLVRVCKNLERIGDLSTNIAEDVIYINDAKMVRHNSNRSSI